MIRYQYDHHLAAIDTGVHGMYGKDPKLAALQDLLIYVLTGLSQVVLLGKKYDITDEKIDRFSVRAIFSTTTGVNVDPERFFRLIREAVLQRDTLKAAVRKKGGNDACPAGPADLLSSLGPDEMIKHGETVGIQAYPADNPDIALMKQTVLYGIKGICAYADHALLLEQEDDGIYQFIHEGLAALHDKDLGLEDWLHLSIRCGEVALKALQLLNKGNTQTYGQPVPTNVPFGFKKGKAILVSGRDFKILDLLLKQTHEKEITIYTHGEMIVANTYPELKRFPHFFGQFGANQQQHITDFSDFPGAVLMTTNCIQRPGKIGLSNIFTCGMVGCPGIDHINDSDFSPVIEKALSCPGFSEDKLQGEVMVGLSDPTILNVSDIFPKASLPAFLSPNILAALVKLISIKPPPP